jgi:hypothetical protein
VGFVVDNMSPGQVSIRMLRFLPVITILQMHDTHPHTHTHTHKFTYRLLLPELQTVEVLKPSTNNALADKKKPWTEKNFGFFFNEVSLTH